MLYKVPLFDFEIPHRLNNSSVTVRDVSALNINLENLLLYCRESVAKAAKIQGMPSDLILGGNRFGDSVCGPKVVRQISLLIPEDLEA